MQTIPASAASTKRINGFTLQQINKKNNQLRLVLNTFLVQDKTIEEKKEKEVTLKLEITKIIEEQKTIKNNAPSYQEARENDLLDDSKGKYRVYNTDHEDNGQCSFGLTSVFCGLGRKQKDLVMGESKKGETARDSLIGQFYASEITRLERLKKDPYGTKEFIQYCVDQRGDDVNLSDQNRDERAAWTTETLQERFVDMEINQQIKLIKDKMESAVALLQDGKFWNSTSAFGYNSFEPFITYVRKCYGLKPIVVVTLDTFETEQLHRNPPLISHNDVIRALFKARILGNKRAGLKLESRYRDALDKRELVLAVHKNNHWYDMCPVEYDYSALDPDATTPVNIPQVSVVTSITSAPTNSKTNALLLFLEDNDSCTKAEKGFYDQLKKLKVLEEKLVRMEENRSNVLTEKQLEAIESTEASVASLKSEINDQYVTLDCIVAKLKTPKVIQKKCRKCPNPSVPRNFSHCLACRPLKKKEIDKKL